MEKLSQAKPEYVMGVRVIKAKDKSPLSGAKVVVISFSEPDQEFIASEEGLASFSLMEGTDYMVVGSRDGFVGMLTGTAENGSDKANIIHLVEAFGEDKTLLPVVAQIIDKDGYKIIDAKVTVTENISRKEIASKFGEGFLSFLGEEGKQ